MSDQPKTIPAYTEYAAYHSLDEKRHAGQVLFVGAAADVFDDIRFPPVSSDSLRFGLPELEQWGIQETDDLPAVRLKLTRVLATLSGQDHLERGAPFLEPTDPAYAAKLEEEQAATYGERPPEGEVLTAIHMRRDVEAQDLRKILFWLLRWLPTI